MQKFRDDYYEILGLQHTAASNEIRENFIKLSKKNHPDQGGSDRLMQMINEAYSVLGDPRSRQEYDNWLRNGRTASAYMDHERGEDRITEVTTLSSSFAIPQVCACCMKPHIKSIRFPIKAHTKRNTYIISSVKVPLCQECLSHVRRYRRKAIFTVWLVAFLIAFIQDILARLSGMNPFLSGVVSIAVGLTVTAVIYNKIKIKINENTHYDDDFPIGLEIEKNGIKKFTFCNPVYAKMFADRNIGASVSRNITGRENLETYYRKKRTGYMVNKVFVISLVLCFLTAVMLGASKNAGSGDEAETAGMTTTVSEASSTEQETSVSAAPYFSWEGTWDTDYGELELKKDTGPENKYTGTYTSPGGTITGIAAGNELKGTFEEEGSSGTFTFTMDEGGSSFSGVWGFEGAEEEYDWDGTKIVYSDPTEETAVPETTIEETSLPYESQARPDTSMVMSYTEKENIAPFKVITQEADTDYFIRLVDKKTGSTVYEFYIRGGETMSCDIALGTYILRYASGEIWYGEEHLFGPDTAYSEGTDELEFYESGVMVYGYTITLYKVVGGNFDTKNISPDDFNN